ncbi:hypothetical protein D3C75_717290 [compost metagenome]
MCGVWNSRLSTVRLNAVMPGSGSPEDEDVASAVSISLTRADTNATAFSKLSMPETQAAAYSPVPQPITAAG